MVSIEKYISNRKVGLVCLWCKAIQVHIYCGVLVQRSQGKVYTGLVQVYRTHAYNNGFVR